MMIDAATSPPSPRALPESREPALDTGQYMTDHQRCRRPIHGPGTLRTEHPASQRRRERRLQDDNRPQLTCPNAHVLARGLQFGTLNRLVRWPAMLWLGGGAAISLGVMSRGCGAIVMLGTDLDPAWRYAAIGIAVAFAVTATAVAWSEVVQPKIAVLCCGLGVALLMVVFAMQSPGLWITSRRMSTEEGMNDPLRVFEGLLLASAPASILAVRIGRMKARARSIWWSGIAGLWAPLLASATLFSLAKMGGARLHWKPSIPIGFQFAFSGSPHIVPLFFVAGLTMFGPGLVCAIWLRDLGWSRALATVLLGGLSCVLMLTDPALLPAPYYRPWCWTVIGGSGVLGVICLLMNKARRQVD
jgi:hypothetical protein